MKLCGFANRFAAVAVSCLALLATAALFNTAAAAPPKPGDYFRLRIVDDQTGRGVPLAEVKTVDGTTYLTDSAGLVAFYEPEQMDQGVFFYVSSHGYEMPADGFGFRGLRLTTTPGGEREIRIRRVNIAERLYRVTGAGIYRDTVLSGGSAPIAQPLLNAQVTGSDSVQTAVYRGQVHWFWGDTNRPKYPLGLFHVPGATSRMPSDGGLDPAVGVDLQYLVNDEGFARATAEMEGEGPTWIDGLIAVPTPDGEQQMYCGYMKVRKFLEVYRRGIARWDDEAEKFVHVADIPLDAPALPHGHAMHHAEGGVDYVYFGNPLPLTRVRATPEAIVDLAQYENYTCLRAGVQLNERQRQRGDVTVQQLDRDQQVRLQYGWKRGTSLVDQQLEQRLRRAGKLRADEGILRLVEAGTDKPVLAHAGSAAFNAHRGKFVMIFCQSGGASNLGETWYAEANRPTGPWQAAVKIVSHNKYSFYNPRHHPFFDQQGGRVIYFEGTYTAMFSGNEHPTPRYEYNQVMYRLDLDDPRLSAAQANR